MVSHEQVLSHYMQTRYDDAHLAALLAHAEDGKLSFMSCCCFAGIPGADHALRGANMSEDTSHWDTEADEEWIKASEAFCLIAASDKARCEKLIPLIHAEMKRRDEIALATSAEMVFQEHKA